MIRYTLRCSKDHAFESWFRSADDFETQKSRGLVECPVCGDGDIRKSLMAPRVTTSRAKAAEPAMPAEPEAAQTSQSPVPATEAVQDPRPKTAQTPEHPTPTPEQIEQSIADMRNHVEKTSDYVGKEFAKEARKMHDGESEARAIYGEAKLDDAKALIEDGIPVVPLPFKPKQKMN